ncbi:hypothetical protein FDI34_gp42 [Acinetobacter phage vB_ApiP_P2]|uniref:Uncharacterized protein n=2 Tax=Friunavirus TaxID=1985711 RepID=A0A221SC30_9CAUD|nr:hypothetical protein FDI34_gp42 [Acinetobacter phage vB_ApiP_P2]QGK90492.1 hypothetical protein APK87_42 [Acinetobacter phage vB_AbaP_APK87]HCH8289395.1 hypothetical protein [Salmonella enterica]ASN73552.1 hypothetical protein P2_42 [Acinetobacter phage vB_ApiP_P2]HCH8436856.1 hypothetical protein [Salmonella enterica]HCH9029330.1 hypothetical protein [Salmonella enterica]
MAGAIGPPIVSEAITGGASDPQLGAIQASIDEVKTAVAAVKTVVDSNSADIATVKTDTTTIKADVAVIKTNTTPTA